MESSLNNKIKNQAADIGQLSQRLEIIYKGLKPSIPGQTVSWISGSDLELCAILVPSTINIKVDSGRANSNSWKEWVNQNLSGVYFFYGIVNQRPVYKDGFSTVLNLEDNASS